MAPLYSLKNVNRNKIAQEFCVWEQKLQSRLNDHLSRRIISGLRKKKLGPEPKKCLYDYFIELDKIHMLFDLILIEFAANVLLQMNKDSSKLWS